MADTSVTVAARLDRLPPSRHTRWLVTLVSLGGWFEFYDLFFTAYIAIGLFKAKIFTPTTQGLFDLQGFASFIAALFTGLFIAVPVVAFIAWQLVPLTILGLDGWRWVVIIGSLGAAVIWWIRRNLPESPRWLDQHGRTAE